MGAKFPWVRFSEFEDKFEGHLPMEGIFTTVQGVGFEAAVTLLIVVGQGFDFKWMLKSAPQFDFFLCLAREWGY